MPETQPRTPLLECREVDIRIGTVDVARRLTLTIHPGQCWCILGRNGVGKTTLLHTLAGLRPPQRGNIELQGRPLQAWSRREIAQRLGILLQSHEDSFPATVLETVLQGRHPYHRPWQWEDAADLQLARQALQRVDLEDFQDRDILTLSGGERRRIGLATLLAQDTPLMLLDEPTSHLDLHHSIAALKLLVDLCRDSKRAVVMVLHDVNLTARFADHVLLLSGSGETIAGRSERVLTTDTLERLYGLPLLGLETPTGPA
ncbi:MAG TPA: ABC transporter ATP-binding protein, partial [Gammaproteobacteria bacterium]|nr:ABC transporter ATP-binding protein [Gammaproteobacteria bacterium]